MALKDHPADPGCLGFYDKKPSQANRGFFGLSRAKPIDYVNPGRTGRCDEGRLSVYGFHDWLESKNQCSCGSEEQPDLMMGHHIITMENLKNIYVVKDILPYGFIVYMELENPQDEISCCELPHSDCARTLQELFRLMIEWESAHLNFGSKEQIAEVCHGMLRSLEIPPDIYAWLSNDVPPEKVEKYLLGRKDARTRNDPAIIPEMSNSFDSWIESKIINCKSLGETPEIAKPR